MYFELGSIENNLNEFLEVVGTTQIIKNYYSGQIILDPTQNLDASQINPVDIFTCLIYTYNKELIFLQPFI